MGLFSKKEKRTGLNMPTRPTLEPPVFPSNTRLDIPEFPSYEPIEQPMREENNTIKNIALSEDYPENHPFMQEMPLRDHAQEIFVKIDKYREALSTIEKVKSKLKQSEIIIKKLEEIREREEKEFEDWRNSINEIKQKLLYVDKSLFEV